MIADAPFKSKLDHMALDQRHLDGARIYRIRIP